MKSTKSMTCYPSPALLFLLCIFLEARICGAFLSAASGHPALAQMERRSSLPKQVAMALLPESSTLFLSDAFVSSIQQEPVMQLSKETTIIVFVVGVIPFAIATFEFWRRIAVGASFGTNDPVVFIGENDAPSSSRGKQVLGKDSLITAYIIFAVVIAVLGLVIFSVLTSPDPELAQGILTSSTDPLRQQW